MTESKSFEEEKPIKFWTGTNIIYVICLIIIVGCIIGVNSLNNEKTDLILMNKTLVQIAEHYKEETEYMIIDAALMFNKYKFAHEGRLKDNNSQLSNYNHVKNVTYLMDLYEDQAIDGRMKFYKKCTEEYNLLPEATPEMTDEEFSKANNDKYFKASECNVIWGTVEERVYEIMKPRYDEFLKYR